MYKTLKTIYKKSKIITSIILIIFTLQTKILFAQNNSNNIDASDLKEIINLVEKNKLNKAIQIANKNNSVDLINLINWIYIFTENEIEIEELIKMYEKFEDWPKANLIKVLIEKKIGWESDDISHYQFIDENKPVSALGNIKLANYNFKSIDTKQIIINNWINNSFSKNDEKFIMSNYKNLFDNNIKYKRLDYLIWNKKWSSAYRQLKEINSDYSNLYKARIKLSRKEYGVDAAIKKVPEYLINDEGLTYERVKWRRHAKLSSSLDLLSNYLDKNEKLKYKEKWWTEIIIHTRKLLKEKKYLEAYNLLSNHKQTNTYNLSRAEWLLGWIALTHLSKPKEAQKHFSNLEKIVNMPISVARANYWLAITEKELDNNALANEYFEKAAVHNSTYYGLLAEQAIKKEGSINFINLQSKNIIYEKNESIFYSLRLLARANEKKYSTKFINGLFQQNISEQDIINILKIFEEEKRPDLLVKACKKAVRLNIKFQNCLFPYPNNIKINEATQYIDTALIFAIIKQESEFYTSAISRAGARGLMQIMPFTAKITAKSLNIKYDKDKILSDAEYNIKIGSKYFSQLYQEFDNSIILSIAGYNAGPANVRKWLKIYGDPRNEEISYINWIESIPFSETRNYVQRVIENYVIYQKVILNNRINSLKSINEIINNG